MARALKYTPALEAKEMRRLDIDRCEDMFLSLAPSIRQGDPQAIRAAVQVLSYKASINGYKSPDLELKIEPGPTWAAAVIQEQTVNLFKQAMTLLIESGIKLEEMAAIAGPENPSIEVEATKIDQEDK